MPEGSSYATLRLLRHPLVGQVVEMTDNRVEVIWENGRWAIYTWQGEGESARIPWYGDIKNLEVVE